MNMIHPLRSLISSSVLLFLQTRLVLPLFLDVCYLFGALVKNTVFKINPFLVICAWYEKWVIIAT